MSGPAYPHVRASARGGKAPAKNQTALTGVVKPFDPADHTVAEVLAYAEANPGEVQAIVDAEYAGKNRTGVLDALTS